MVLDPALGWPATSLCSLTAVIDALFGLADTISTIRNLVRRAWTTHYCNTRPQRRL
jgi:hypothetical protein